MPPGRCPFQPPTTWGPPAARTGHEQHSPFISTTTVKTANTNSSDPSTTGMHNRVKAAITSQCAVGSSGISNTRSAAEASGKKLLIGEVRLDRYPAGWTYKISINQEHLPPKTVPNWTVWLEAPVYDSITLEVFARDPSSIGGLNNNDEEEEFVAIGSKKIFQPLSFFTIPEVDFASARVPSPWGEQSAPDVAVVLEMRLETDASQQEGVFGRGSLSTRCCAVREKVKVSDRQDAGMRGLEHFEEAKAVAPPPLTDIEVVIVKDSYNKALAWVDSILEFVVERLYFLAPTLPDILGGLAPNLQRYLHGILDLAVRSLDPKTENISREAYGPVHPDETRPHQDMGGYAQTLAEQGFRLAHWELVRDLWMEALRSSPYMEAYELRNMELGTGSAAYRFFELHVMRPVADAIAEMDAVYQDDTNAMLMMDSWYPYTRKPHLKRGLGVELYARLFSQHPHLAPSFNGADMDSLSEHVGKALELVATSLHDMGKAMPALRHLGVLHANLGVPTSAHDAIVKVGIELLRNKMEMKGFRVKSQAVGRLRNIWAKAWRRAAFQIRLPMDNAERLVSKAYEWIHQAAHELQWDETYTASRKGQVYREVINHGTYSHTAEELVHGARVCWRNSAKCIGRIAWNTLVVRDKRHVVDLAEMFAECMEHQRLAMADGSIKSVMTVFRPQAPGERMGTRFWNSQLTRYAAYTLEDGSVIGDKANLELTKEIIGNGWVPPSPRGHFDILPIVFETADKEIRMFDVPPEYAREVYLEHPEHPAFAKLGLKWGAVPSITNFTMSLGGINYTACPFNGWFMNTEVARDLMEDGRCGRSHDIAASFGIKVSETDPFWKDRTFLELNRAVMHSFRKDGTSVVDHHTASQQFLTHDLREKRVGRECPAQWSWIVPPLGGSLTSVFHHEMRHFDMDPRFLYQAEIYKVNSSEYARVGDGTGDKKAVAKKKRVLVLYGSETGTAEGYAYDTAAHLRSFDCHVAPLDDMEPSDLTGSDVHAVLVVMSTFGEGEMPHGAAGFYKRLQASSPGALSGVRYAMMALGSSSYQNFCKAGKDMDRAWTRLGANAISEIRLGDELDGQAESVRDWQSHLDPVLGAGVLGAAVDGATADQAAKKARLVVLDKASDEVQHARASPWEYVRKGFTLATVVRNEELFKPATEMRSTRLVEIDIAGDSPLRYETGDHVSILPSNDPALVAGVLKHVGADHSQWFTLEDNPRPGLPVPVSVARAFVHELDLSTKAPVAGLLELLLRRSSKDEDKQRVKALLEGQGQPGWTRTESRFLNKHTTVLSVLEEFPSASVSMEDLVLTLPLMKARHYSISSAAEEHPTTLQLTVGVLKVHHKEEGTIRKGLCSHFLRGVRPGELVRVSIRPSSFRAPADLAASPVIMVGPGTGISPIMGFLQARAKALRQGTVLAPCLVYFGCRDSSEALYAEQLRTWRNNGVITELHVAMSREGPKTYVQHLIARDQTRVWELLRNPTCHVYVCGDSGMGEEVKTEMMMATLSCSPMDPPGVTDFFATMKRDGRLQFDTWGAGKHDLVVQSVLVSNHDNQGRWKGQDKQLAAATVPALAKAVSSYSAESLVSLPASATPAVEALAPVDGCGVKATPRRNSAGATKAKSGTKKQGTTSAGPRITSVFEAPASGAASPKMAASTTLDRLMGPFRGMFHSRRGSFDTYFRVSSSFTSPPTPRNDAVAYHAGDAVVASNLSSEKEMAGDRVVIPASPQTGDRAVSIHAFPRRRQ